MEMPHNNEQVELIRQVFGYINQFKGTIFVIKIEDEIIMHPHFSFLVSDITLLHNLGIRIVLVPGAKTRIDEILKKFNIKWQTKDGIRITAPESIPFIKMAAFDVSNKIMTQLSENKADAVIGNWVRARAIGIKKGTDYQLSGSVEKIKTDILLTILAEGMIPIFPNIGWSIKGQPYNISSNELAETIGKELHAEKIFFLVNHSLNIKSNKYTIPAMLDFNQENSAAQFNLEQIRSLLNANKKKAQDPLLEVLSVSYRACQSGIKRVHILDGRQEGAILKEIFSSQGSGIMIYSDEHAHIRPMEQNDIPDVLRIMQPLVAQDILIPRTKEDIEEKLSDYFVYEVDGFIHGCGALHTYREKNSTSGEIAALAVNETFTRLGVGKKIATFLLKRASKLRLKKIFVLTTQTLDWFFELGFTKGALTDLPTAKQQQYNTKRKSAILLYYPPK